MFLLLCKVLRNILRIERFLFQLLRAGYTCTYSRYSCSIIQLYLGRVPGLEPVVTIPPASMFHDAEVTV